MVFSLAVMSAVRGTRMLWKDSGLERIIYKAKLPLLEYRHVPAVGSTKK